MAYSCVRAQFEIGHEASIRNKWTVEGFTHDWEVFVRGVDNADIHHFVEKVVFHLHSSFAKPRRTVKEPPYCVKESGYAGFSLAIDIHFKTKDEPKKVRFYYDLTLQNSGPRLSNAVREKTDFTNPSEDFRRKLIRGGGIGIGSDGGALGMIDKNTNNSNININFEEKKTSPVQSKSKGTSSSSIGDSSKKHKPKESLKPEETKGNNSFAALFGTPIKTVKHSPTSSKPISTKLPQQESKKSHEKQAKEVTKTKHSPHKEKDKERDTSSSKKEKDPDRNANKEKERSREKEKEKNKEKVIKKNSPPPLPIASVPLKTKDEISTKKIQEETIKEKQISKVEIKTEKKHKEKKNREDRDKKERHKDHHDKKDMEKEKIHEKVDKKVEIKDSKESSKSKSNSSKEEKRNKNSDKEKVDFDKQKHKHKKRDKHRDEDRERQKKRDIEKTQEIVKIKPKSPSPLPPPPPPAPTPKATIHPLNMLIQELPEKDSDSDSSLINDEESKIESPGETSSVKHKIEEPRKPPPPEIKEEKVKKRDRKMKDEDREMRKRKKRAKEREEPPEKSVKIEIKEEKDMSPLIKDESRSPSPEMLFTEAYVTQLKDLQRKIMTLQDNADLQRVVQVISETGQFEITQRTFDFDLCALDKSTVKRLQDMFIAAS